MPLNKTVFFFVTYLIFGLLLYFFFFSYRGPNVSIDNLEFLSEELPPFNYTVDGIPKGIAIETLDFILKETNSSQTIDDISFHNWSTSYFKALASPKAVLFSTTRTKDREHIFKWAGPIVDIKRAIFTLNKNSNKLKQTIDTDIEQIKFAVPINTIDGNLLMQSGVPKKNIIFVNNLNDALDLLLEGKVEAIACNTRALKHILTEEKATNIKLIKVIGEFYHYFAFNKKVPDDVIASFQKAINMFKETDAYKKAIDDL